MRTYLLINLMVLPQAKISVIKLSLRLLAIKVLVLEVARTVMREPIPLVVLPLEEVKAQNLESKMAST